MFSLLRLAIWIAGIVTLTVLALRYFGYEPNWQYLNEQKALCDSMLASCRGTLVMTGVEGAQKDCRWNCIEPSLLIRKSSEN